MKPGAVTSADLTAPPGVSAASSTRTDQPASARTLAATRPLGPEPITTASVTPHTSPRRAARNRVLGIGHRTIFPVALRPVSSRRTERLLNLVICLLHTRSYLTAERIHDLVPGYDDTPSAEAFKRAFERDKEDLRDLGIPLETGTNSAFDDEPGYRIARRDYALPEITLESDEAAAVGLAARMWSSAALGSAATRALRKLEAAGV